jgi:hypothetical protein
VKANTLKRAVALALAVLILLGTLGYFLSTVAYGAMSESQDLGSNYSAKYEVTDGLKDGKITTTDPVTIEVELTVPTPLTDKPTVTLDPNGAFRTDTGNAASKVTVDSGADTEWTITFANVVYNNADSGNKEKLEFRVNNGNKLSVAIAECKVSSSGDDNNPGGDNNNEPALPSNMTYTIERIYRSSNGENVTYIPGDSSKNDPSIHRGYYVDAMVRFSIPGVTKADIIANSTPNVQILVDRGGFRFQSATDSAIKIERVEETSSGVICHVSLKALYYTGTGSTLAFTVQSKDNNENAAYIYEQFTAEVSSCVPYTPREDDNDDTPDYGSMQMATPYVIVSNYNYGGTVTAGDTFTLSLTFYNTSRNIDVSNMMITVTMPEALMLTSSSNTFYVDQLDSEATVTETIQVTAKANAAPQSHNIDVSMKYQYVDDHLVSRRDNTTQETISIPIIQVDRFQVTGVEVSPEIYLNEESYLTVNFVNKGRSDVYNLSAEISGDIQNPGQQQNLGNLTSGSTGTADFYITPNAEGVCSGEVKITYEDTNMEEKTATILWSTTVVDPMGGMDMGMGIGPGMEVPGMMDDPSLMDEEKKSPTPFIIGGVVAAAAVAGLLIRRRILKKRSEEADANL